METGRKKKNDWIFIGTLIILVIALTCIAFGLLYLSYSSNMVLYQYILNIILLIIILVCFYIAINTLFIVRLLSGKKLFKISRRIVGDSLTLLYPQILFLSQLLGLEKDKIRGVFSEINNRLIITNKIDIKPEEMLLLLPHCLQKSSCAHKITTDIQNCKKCGACDINVILDIKKDYNVKIYVATGGTLARKIVKEVKPKVIIAVACERDLSSGILDIKGIPVVGILLERPEGPCVNTRVDLTKVREVIKLFIKEEDNSCISTHPIMDSDQG